MIDEKSIVPESNMGGDRIYINVSGVLQLVLKDGSILTESHSKLVGAGLYLFYALAIVAGGTMLGFGIKKMLK